MFKWQDAFILEISFLSDKEIFEILIYEYSCDDRFCGRDKWKHEQLVHAFRVRMGWES